MGNEKSERIQTSFLNRAEKVALVWLAERQPRWVTSDMLTYIGVVGALVCAIGFALGCVNVNYLWLSSFGLFINWYGDSLDGTLARVRNTQRPKYGFFIDHSLDVVTICLMCVGAGLSPVFRLDVALMVLAAYLGLSVYTYIGTIIKGQFLLTYAGFGPTELRLIVILMNTLYMYIEPLRTSSWTIGNQTLHFFDILGIVIVVLMTIMWLAQFGKDRKVLSELDPLKPYNPDEKK
jgi:phosphatidylglycerophosphate synthase